jgi:hypothetical protein
MHGMHRHGVTHFDVGLEYYAWKLWGSTQDQTRAGRNVVLPSGVTFVRT